jgi:hypothetical protein
MLLSRALFSAVLRSPSLLQDATLLPQVLEGCRCDNAVTARHAFAVLLQLAAVSTIIHLLLSSSALHAA